MKSALLVVDMQNDFCPGGALGVPGGDEIIPLINRYIGLFISEGIPVIASRDWHPPETRHFSAFGGIWPAHCVQGTSGAEFRDDLQLPESTPVFSKGMDPEQDDYSAFHAVSSDGMSLPDYLLRMGIGHLYLCGLATDYCIRHTALEGIARSFSITILADAIRGVDLVAGDSRRALDEVQSAGAVCVMFPAVASGIRNALK